VLLELLDVPVDYSLHCSMEELSSVSRLVGNRRRIGHWSRAGTDCAEEAQHVLSTAG